ncbi:MAG: MBL fold metallo-hydrolase [Anaerolineae bacterium]|nr:MBL fold metallo-hydrolase [Anaerolineae bacterium]MCB0249595.1 MBL fold metallo-hydrolase [Anaerolineae bacterium]
MQEIAPGVYVNLDFRGCNVGLIETDDGNILIDTPMIPSESRRWLEYIRQITGNKPILYVINTDHHRGHVLGNQYYDAPVIAHDLAWKNMRGYGANFCQRVVDSFKREPKIQAELADLRIVRPTITFDTRMDIDHGGRTVRLIHVGGHTEATIVIWLPEEKVLFAGDTVWWDQHPYMAQANSKQWLDALRQIRKLHPQIIVPGHGPLTTVEATEPLSAYIRYVRRQVRIRIRRGYSKQETASSLVKQLVPMFTVNPDRRGKIESQIKQAINRVYNEYKKGAEAEEQDEDQEKEIAPDEVEESETDAGSTVSEAGAVEDSDDAEYRSALADVGSRLDGDADDDEGDNDDEDDDEEDDDDLDDLDEDGIDE